MLSPMKKSRSYHKRMFFDYCLLGSVSLCLVFLLGNSKLPGNDGTSWCGGWTRRSEPKLQSGNHDKLILLLDELNCTKIVNDSPGPLYNETTFLQLQDIYRQVVPQKQQTISKHPSNGFLVPIEIGYAEGSKGRGVFATHDITKGTGVWFYAQHAVFSDEESFVRFLSRLADKRLVCDILVWSYVEIREGEPYAVVELDMGSLMNDGGDSSNLIEPVDGIQIAKRDITAGEELTFSYNDIPYDHDLRWYTNLKHRTNVPEDVY